MDSHGCDGLTTAGVSALCTALHIKGGGRRRERQTDTPTQGQTHGHTYTQPYRRDVISKDSHGCNGLASEGFVLLCVQRYTSKEVDLRGEESDRQTH